MTTYDAFALELDLTLLSRFKLLDVPGKKASGKKLIQLAVETE